MTNRNQIWKCARAGVPSEEGNVCGNIVEVLHEGADALVCCDKPMILMEANSVDADKEKHVPVVEDTEDGQTLVSIGSEPHPMTEDHYIEWVEIDLPGEEKACRKTLKPGEKPEAKFRANISEISVRAYCNLHGLWFQTT